VSAVETWSDLKAATARARVALSEESHRIFLPGGGSIQLISAYDPDAGRGIYLDGAILDECSLQSERSWRNLRPTLSDYGGWALLCGTVPEDVSGHWFALLHKYALGAAGMERGWATWRRPSWENPQMTQADLGEARETHGLRFFLREYGAELLTAEGGIWKEEWLQRAYEPEGGGVLPADVQAMEILVDAAWKTGILNDWTVAQLWCRTPKGFCVVDELRGKWESPVMRRRVSEFRERWELEATRLGLSLPVVVEAVGGGLVAVQEFRAACEFPVIEYEVRGSSKLARWEATSPEAEAGRVWHPPEGMAPWVAAWREELVGAPQLPHDDRCDVYAMAIQRLRRPVEPVHAFARPKPAVLIERGGY
jgi:predicted phage terminase large subunit-like protein